MNYTVIREDELYHHGILGQKWGVRRYQNEDGTLTAAGRKRYGENLDINDKSRKNVAKIRLGEARRRLDVAKENSKSKGRNDYRVAEMRDRVRSAKKEVRKARRIDRGAALASKGRTIGGNSLRRYAAVGAAMMASTAWRSLLNKGITNLGNSGKLAPHHVQSAKIIANVGDKVVDAALIAYVANNYRQSNDMRAYRNARLYGDSTISRVGSQEYKDVVARRKEKK